MQKTLKITFLSDWQISSGVGDGFLADSVLIRDGDGFPYIPGRALKGFLREGARRLGLCRKDLQNAETLFFGNNDPSLDTRESGVVRLSSAHIAPILKAQLDGCVNPEEFIADLTVLRRQTALNENGTAETGSLRCIECGIQGLEMFATIEVNSLPEIPDSWIESYFAAVCAAVKSVGGGRSRGMGRCQVTIEGHRDPIKLPAANSYLESLGGRA